MAKRLIAKVEKKPIAVILFSGGGGVEAGMLAAGIEPVLAVEYDPGKPELSKAIAVSHEANFKRCKVIRRTVSECAADNFPGFPQEPDILWASPVCSNFSVAKNGEERVSDVISAKAIVGAIAGMRPKHFFLENVTSYRKSVSWQGIEMPVPMVEVNQLNLGLFLSLISHPVMTFAYAVFVLSYWVFTSLQEASGERWRGIKSHLTAMGYQVAESNVDMSDYGVPQARVRFVVRACWEGKPLPLPEKQPKIGWYDAIADLIPDLPSSQLLKGQQASVDKFLESNQPAPLLIDRAGGRGRYRAVPAYRPTNTILRSTFTDGKNSNRTKFADIWLPDGTVKSASIECMARLQGFPDWYQFPERVAIAGSIIGYSVPPKFVEQLVKPLTTRGFSRSEHDLCLDEIAEAAKEMGQPNAMPTLEYGGNGNHALADSSNGLSAPNEVIEEEKMQTINLGKVFNGAAVPCPSEALNLLSSKDFIKCKDEPYGCVQGLPDSGEEGLLTGIEKHENNGDNSIAIANQVQVNISASLDVDPEFRQAQLPRSQRVNTSWGVFQWKEEVLLWVSEKHKDRIDWEGLECLILEENDSQKLVIPYGFLPINKDGLKPIAPSTENARFRKPWWIEKEELYSALSLAEIRRDGGTQPREKLDLAHVAVLSEAIKDGAELEPVVVFFDGTDYWLADGYHRCKATEDAGFEDIQCIIHQGTRRDAILYSVGANAEHKAAKPRSRADKRRAVMMLLNDPEWSKWSDREIARQCKVDHKTVGRFRSSLTGEFPSEDGQHGQQRTYKTKHGTTATMKVGNIGNGKNDLEAVGAAEYPLISNGESIVADGNGNGINRPANRWYGGKWRIGKWIASHFPDHKIYVEPFGGMWSVGLQKPQSEVEVYNDIHPGATNFWLQLRDNSEQLISVIDAINFNEKTVQEAQQPSTDPVECAVKFYIQCRITFAGGGTGWASGYSPKSFDKKENSDHSHLVAIAKRIKNLQIYGEDALDIIRKFDSPDTLFYCDPPYVKETRNSHTPYEYEFERHEELIALLGSIQGKAIISGYPSFKYASLLSGWNRKDTQGMTTSSKDAMECIWIKPTVRTIDYLIGFFSNIDYMSVDQLKEARARIDQRLAAIDKPST
ncbi:DNA cytosine methyltransferase [Coleofasciculus sp.]|uniref:DNA cytosine methyltransferase n=1 Tax=Coleofasciculus sp. TaxID=3100458 RepID=UPI003A1E40EC